jgi:proline iminopeptidase
MKIKTLFWVITLLTVSFNVNAQVAGKKFQTNLEGIGTITMEFKASTYELSDSGGIKLVEGNYTIEGEIITFIDTKGSMACEPDVKGKYELIIGNEELKLKLIDDRCEGRAGILKVAWEQAVQAQERQVLTSDGVRLYVKVKGRGTPCLYIHGGPGSGSFWLEKFCGDFLEQHFQMIYLDQRGVCRSSSPKDKNYSMDRMVKDFEEVRVALGIKQWVTLGHSFGGILQMGYAQHCSPVIKGMIMINCGLNLKECYDSSWCPKAAEFLNVTNCQYFKDGTIPIIVRWDSLIHALNKNDLMWKMGYSCRKNMEIMNATFDEIPNWNSEFGNTALTINDYWGDFQKETVNMTMPVLFFYGKKDWMVGPEHYKGIKFPNIMLWGSDVGHIPFIENKEDMIKAIESYIDKYKF